MRKKEGHLNSDKDFPLQPAGGMWLCCTFTWISVRKNYKKYVSMVLSHTFCGNVLHQCQVCSTWSPEFSSLRKRRDKNILYTVGDCKVPNRQKNTGQSTGDLTESVVSGFSK